MRQLARVRVARSLSVVALLATLTAGAVFAGSSPASAATNFKLPFRCGETWKASTYRGHTSNSVDWNRSGEDRGYPVLASAAGTFRRVNSSRWRVEDLLCTHDEYPDEP